MASKDSYSVSLIDTCSPDFELGVKEMDGTHRELAALVNALATAKGCDFVHLFTTLFDHTERHFAREKQLMEQSGFPAIGEHVAEHQRVLGELHQCKRKVCKGEISFARAYITDRLPEWFRLHIATMDSALASHLKLRETAQA